MGTADGLSKHPYIREARRIRALRTVVEQDVSAEFQRGPRAAHFPDSVGVGWYPIDIHRSGPEDVGVSTRTRPFQIPLGALIPTALANVAAGLEEHRDDAHHERVLPAAPGGVEHRRGCRSARRLVARPAAVAGADLARRRGDRGASSDACSRTASPLAWIVDVPARAPCVRRRPAPRRRRSAGRAGAPRARSRLPRCRRRTGMPGVESGSRRRRGQPERRRLLDVQRPRRRPDAGPSRRRQLLLPPPARRGPARRDAAAARASRAARSTSSPRRAGSSSTSRSCRRASSATRRRSRRPPISPRPATSRSGSRGARPKGLEFGERADALDSLLAWLPQRRRARAPGDAHRGGRARPSRSAARSGRGAFCARPAPPRATTGSCSRSRTTATSRPSRSSGSSTQVGDDLRRLLRHGQRPSGRRRRGGGGAATLAVDRDPAPEGLRRRRGTTPSPGPVSVPLGEGVIPIEAVLDACPHALACIELGQLGPGRRRAGARRNATSSTFAPDDGGRALRPLGTPRARHGRRRRHRARDLGGARGAGARVAVLGRSATADEAAARIGGIAVRADLSDRARAPARVRVGGGVARRARRARHEPRRSPRRAGARAHPSRSGTTRSRST